MIRAIGTPAFILLVCVSVVMIFQGNQLSIETLARIRTGMICSVISIAIFGDNNRLSDSDHSFFTPTIVMLISAFFVAKMVALYMQRLSFDEVMKRYLRPDAAAFEG